MTKRASALRNELRFVCEFAGISLSELQCLTWGDPVFENILNEIEALIEL
eukprot:gene34693-42792_t